MPPSRNDLCPCGSGRRYKRCCRRRSAASSPAGAAAAELAPNLILRQVAGREWLALSFPFDDALNTAVKRLPGRRFEWDRREWLVPCEPRVAAMVADLLRDFPLLVAGPNVERWLASERSWRAWVTVEEVAGDPVFAVFTLGGAPPAPELAAGRGWVALRADSAHAMLLAGEEGLELDALAERCIAELRAGRRPPPAMLELGRDAEGEPRLELHPLWGISARSGFEQLPEATSTVERPGRFHFGDDERVPSVPADAALVPALDRFLVAHHAVSVTPAAAEWLDAMRDEHRRRADTVERSHARDAELELPALGGELRPFQRAGVDYALAQRRTFIADEQGLGKTVQALAALEVDGAFPAAVVCPAGLKLNWRRETERWLPDRRVAVIHGRGEKGWSDSGADSAELVLLNYEIVEAHGERLAGRGLRAVVFDESHTARNRAPGGPRRRSRWPRRSPKTGCGWP